MGGEKKRADGLYIDPTGSPPRGRGKGYDVVARFGGIRITPAWAGKSSVTVQVQLIIEDHPRVSGEKAKLAMR